MYTIYNWCSWLISTLGSAGASVHEVQSRQDWGAVGWWRSCSETLESACPGGDCTHLDRALTLTEILDYSWRLTFLLWHVALFISSGWFASYGCSSNRVTWPYSDHIQVKTIVMCFVWSCLWKWFQNFSWSNQATIRDWLQESYHLCAVSLCSLAQFKLLVPVIKDLNSLGLRGLKGHLLLYCPDCQLRSASEALSCVPHFQRSGRQMTETAFSVVMPHFWNTLALETNLAHNFLLSTRTYFYSNFNWELYLMSCLIVCFCFVDTFFVQWLGFNCKPVCKEH